MGVSVMDHNDMMILETEDDVATSSDQPSGLSGEADRPSGLSGEADRPSGPQGPQRSGECDLYKWIRAQRGVAHEPSEQTTPPPPPSDAASSLFGWKHPRFARYARREAEQDDFVLNDGGVEEGALVCSKCGGKRIKAMAMQTRSGDEATTTFGVCKSIVKRNGRSEVCGHRMTL
jgi:hypothetical protein